jgi:uncharacterized membrane protein
MKAGRPLMFVSIRAFYIDSMREPTKFRWILGLTLFCVVGSGTDGGAYFAFSTFVMQALRRLPPAAAVQAMQEIDRAAENLWFAIALFGTGIAAIILGASSIRRLTTPAAKYLLTGSLVYLASLLVTFGCNVPLNNALDMVKPGSADAMRSWQRYWDVWMVWNHIRTITALASTGLFSAAGFYMGQGMRQGEEQ